MKKVAVILGSKSDLVQVDAGLKLLDSLSIGYELKILSAHRNPGPLKSYVKGLAKSGFKVVIACAGLSAALPGVVSSYVDLPVLGVPLYSKAFRGIDSILSILQMPKGVPVGTLTVGSAGMINAAILTARILGLSDRKLKLKLKKNKTKIKQGK